MPETVPPSVLSNFTSPHTIGRRRSPQRKTSTHRTTIPKVTATQGHCPTSGMVTPDTRSHACTGRAPSPRGSYTWGHSLTHRETVYQGHNHTKRQLSNHHAWDTVSSTRTQPHEHGMVKYNVTGAQPTRVTTTQRDALKQGNGLPHTRTQPNAHAQSHTRRDVALCSGP